MTCRVPGCRGPGKSSRYGIYCSAHASAKRRHGHPLQRSVTEADLKPALAVIRDTLAVHPKVLPVLRDRWRDYVVTPSRGVVAKRESGVPGHLFEADAARELLRVDREAAVDDVIAHVLAVLLLAWHLDRRLFRDDAAIRFQMVRRVRALAPGSMGRHGKKQALKDVAPRVIEVMAKRLSDGLGGAGLTIVEREKEAKRRQTETTNDYFSALATLDLPQMSAAAPEPDLPEPIVEVTEMDGVRFERRTMPDGTIHQTSIRAAA